MNKLYLLVFSAFMVSVAQAAAPSGPSMSAVQLYFPCRSCHGDKAEGSEAINTPALAGQSAVYLERQLLMFRDGRRGVKEHDVYGRQMALIAKPLTDNNWLNQLAVYISAMPNTKPMVFLKGEAAYNMCSSCHGNTGQGNEAMGAPMLSGLSARYIDRQLKNYRDGIRGYESSDNHGQTMRAMVTAMSDEDIKRIADLFIQP